jgi:hypothetical protein
VDGVDEFAAGQAVVKEIGADWSAGDGGEEEAEDGGGAVAVGVVLGEVAEEVCPEEGPLGVVEVAIFEGDETRFWVGFLREGRLKVQRPVGLRWPGRCGREGMKVNFRC